jgi:hypothetical protein
MTVKDIKTSLSKLPPDLDDLHILLNVQVAPGEKQFFLLAGIGYIPEPACIILFDHEVGIGLIANKTPFIGKPNVDNDSGT